MRKLTHLVAALCSAVLYLHGQGGDPASLQQVIASRFQLTEIARDRSGVVNPGTLMTLQKDNLLMYSSACPSSPSSTYKNGKLSQSIGHNFVRDLGGSMQMAGNATTAICPQRRFRSGTQLSVTKVIVQREGIVFRLYAAPAGDTPYYGELKFPFEKRSIPSPDDALALIAEVFTVEQAAKVSNTIGNSVAGLYDVQGKPVQMQLNPDGSFSQNSASGQTSPGRYTVNGNVLTLTYAATGIARTLTLQGGNVYSDSRLIWVRRSDGNPDRAGPTPSLRLPSAYAKAEAPADLLQLNADNTFSLQEDGQTYGGTFAANGATLKLSISGGAETTATILGDKLTDSSGQTWVLRTGASR